MHDDAIYLAVDARGGRTDISGFPVDAVSLGRGVFETALVVNSVVVLAAEHRERLEASCEALALASREEAGAIFGEAGRAAVSAPWQCARLRVAVFPDAGSAVGIVALREHAARPSTLALSVSATRRHTGDILARHKTASYLANLVMREAARRDGFDDALVLDTDGNLAETSTANVFLGLDGRIVTPALGCILPGVVRSWTLRTAAGLGIAVAESAIPASALSDAQWAFATNSIAGLAPVSRVDARPLGDPRADGRFSALHDAYESMIRACGNASARRG